MRRPLRLVFLSLMTAAGCAVGTIGDSAEVETASEVRLMENHPNCEDVEVGTDRLSFLWRTDPSAVDIGVGNIVVGQKGGGYVRRITSVATEGNRINVMTEPASLSDAVVAGDFSLPVVPEGAWTQCPDAAACSDFGTIDLSGTVLFDGDVDGVPLSVVIPRGELQFSPAVDFDMSIGFPGKVKHLSGNVSGTFVADIDVEATTGGAVAFEQEIDVSGPDAPLYSYPFTFVVPTPLGPLPIVGTANLDVFVGFRAGASATATLATGVRATAEVAVGATYDDGEWSASAEPSLEAVADPVELSSQATTSVEAYARPEVNVVFYGVAGPRFAVEPLLRFTSELAPPDPLRSKLEACMRGEIGFSVQILSFSVADFSRSLERCLTLVDSEQS